MSQRHRGKIWKSDEKLVIYEKIHLKILMDEQLVQKDVIDEK